jgi:hypothetical protein
VTQAERLRERAAKAFRLAMAISDSPERQELIEIGRELDAEAVKVERQDKTG